MIIINETPLKLPVNNNICGNKLKKKLISLKYQQQTITIQFIRTLISG